MPIRQMKDYYKNIIGIFDYTKNKYVKLKLLNQLIIVVAFEILN